MTLAFVTMSCDISSMSFSMLIFSMLIQDLFHPPLSFFQLFVLYCKLFMGDKTGHPLDEIPQNVPFDTVRLRGVSGMLQLPYGGLVLMPRAA